MALDGGVCVCGVCVLCMCGELTDGGCSADSAADARHALVRLATCKYPLRALAWLGLARLAALPPLITTSISCGQCFTLTLLTYLYVYRLVMVHLCSVVKLLVLGHSKLCLDVGTTSQVYIRDVA